MIQNDMNLIMILLDGARSDRLHLSKELVSISQQGLFFPNMVTSGPYTLISLYGLLTGMYGSKNGLDAYFNMFRYKKKNIKV